MASRATELDDTEEEILQFITTQPGSFAGTAEVAEELDLTTNGASYRLKQLRKKNEIDSRQPSRDEIWYLPNEGQIPGTGSAYGGEPLRKGKTDDEKPDAQISNRRLPGILILVGIGWLAGWNLYKGALLAWRGKDRIIGENGLLNISGGSFEIDFGLVGFFVSAVMAFLSAGLMGMMLLQAVAVAQSGFVIAALGYLIGVAAVVAMLYQFGHRKAKSITQEKTQAQSAEV